MLTNYHMHTEFCDGQVTAEIMAEAAFKHGFKIIGFTSHAPLPFETSWNLPMNSLPNYLAEIDGLRAKYKGSMEILTSLEVDYIAGPNKCLCGPADGRFTGLDFILAAVHYVNPKQATKCEPDNFFAVDESITEIKKDIEFFYGGNTKNYIEDYYTSLSACINDGGFDILAHFDLIKKNNKNQSLFSESSSHYKAAAMLAVDMLKTKSLSESNIIVEINTGGMARGKIAEPYPSPWILKELYARKIPVCVNSDAHAVAHLLAYRDEGLKAAYEAGYREVVAIQKGKRIAIPL